MCCERSFFGIVVLGLELWEDWYLKGNVNALTFKLGKPEIERNTSFIILPITFLVLLSI